ncbi:MAG: hypothetical protein JO040_07095 [Gemmatimonadetes bacterium]|nr:hypothetical protein [Gemmatimonadota bacterium]
MQEKLKLSLDDLRVETFETTPETGHAHGTVHALCDGSCDNCTGCTDCSMCTECSNCSDCTGCTDCSFATMATGTCYTTY